MSHPAHYYIKFMALQGWPDETEDTANMTLRGFGLPEISKDEFATLQAGLDPPPNFAFNSKSHQPTINYLKEEKLFTLWSGRKEDLEAVNLINYPQVRETIQILMLGRFHSKEIRERIKAKYDKDFSEKCLDSFKHYFWNCDLTGMTEIRNMLWNHPMRDAYVASMTGSKNQALFRAGFSPQVDGRKALREAHRNIAMRIEASRILPDNKDTARIVATLSKELVSVHNALYGEGAGVEDMMKDLQRFVMERKAPNVIPIQKLAPKGNFSNSGAKDVDKDGGS